MNEIYEEQESGALDIQKYLQIMRRRYVLFFTLLFIGWLLVWGVSWFLPARYKSSTLILVEQPTMPKNYVVPNISDDMQSRLQSMPQQILSRTRLLVIIDKLELYSSDRRRPTPDEKVERIRKDIDIELVRSAGDQITAFKINYSARDPHIAQRVTSELANLFISENLKVRQQQSEDTTKFIGDRLEIARTNLSEQETKIREFKGEHEGELPSQQASNLQILSGLQAQLQNEQDTINSAKQQRVYLQTLLDQYRSLRTSSGSTSGNTTSLTAIDQELILLKTKLADLSSRYTDHHPDVENLKDEIAKTQKMRDTLIAEARTKGKGSRQADNEGAEHDIAEPSSGLTTLQLQSQLQANQAEITNREQAIARLQAQVNRYQDRLNSEPAREQQLADLTRGYEQSKANYDDLLKKQTDSEMATSMERMQQGERFSTLDPPSLPLKPDFPDRLKFCGIGIGVGLILGLVLIFTLEAIDDRLHSETEIKELLSMAIISEIPRIMTPSDEQSRKRKLVLGWTMTIVIMATILAGSAFSYLHG